MSQLIVGANDSGIDSLVSNLESLVSDISKSLTDMEILMSDSKTYFNGEVGDAMRKKFSDISSNFSNVTANLETYIDDFIKIKHNFEGHDAEFTTSEVETLDVKGGDFNGVK